MALNINTPIDLVPAKAPATPKRTWRPRTMRTFYYKSMNDKPADWARIGHACTRESAVRAAIIKVMLGQYERVETVNEDGINVAIIKKQRGKIVLVCV